MFFDVIETIFGLNHATSSNLPASKSRISTFLASTTRPRFIDGTRTGSATKTRLSQNMVTDGIGYGFSSSRTARSLAGQLQDILFI